MQSQVQQGCGEGSGEGLGGFGAEPGQFRQGCGVPGKVWEALVQSQVRFNRVPEKFRRRFQEALVQSQVRFNRVPDQGGFGAEPGQVQQSSGEGPQGQVRFKRVPEKVAEKVPEKVLGIFGAGPGSTGFRRRFWRRSGRLWCRARSGSTDSRRFQEAMVQSQVRFNRVPEKVPEKVWEVLVQSQVRLNRVREKVPEKVWEALVQS